MAPSKSRQRALARAKYERQAARRAAAARRRRQIQASVAAGIAVVVVVVGIVWAAGGFDHKSKSKTTAADECAWTPVPATGNIKDVGQPPTSGIPKTGSSTMTINTNQGVIEAQLDRAGAPCTAASFAYLAGKHFFDNTKCHRLSTSGIYVLQCGDPSGTGTGGPAYRFPDEKMPTPAADASPSPSASAGPRTDLYPAGTLAMANSGPDTNGSQFFIVYKDGSALDPKYTVFGKVTKGLDLVQKVAAAGHDGAFDPTPGGGHPKMDLAFQSVTVTATPANPAATSSSNS
ncbi:peptidylprolyl isomerase [Planosporangium thailandense]|uniref:Peptidyl-prolyl cis-trans isomerase n=1 Tax=Planosporangium thailandense TaxID=765197 RepID=A0ABX0Y596_9ACTN|nr:peptidylprolyl isomerase [Planosporangium thailandense]